MGESDTPLVDHLVLTEFVSGPPSYSSIHKRVGDRKPSHDLRESWWAVCGFRTEFFQGRQIFGSWFLFKYWVFGEHSPFVEIQNQTSHVYSSCLWTQTLTANPPSSHYFVCRLLKRTTTLVDNISCAYYRVAKTHRIPYLYRSFSAKELFI